jgi:hypothetical protein
VSRLGNFERRTTVIAVERFGSHDFHDTPFQI